MLNLCSHQKEQKENNKKNKIILIRKEQKEQKEYIQKFNIKKQKDILFIRKCKVQFSRK